MLLNVIWALCLDITTHTYKHEHRFH